MKMNPIQEVMQTTMGEIRNMIDVNTVVGDKICTEDGATVIPVSKVSLGFVSGGGEYNTAKENNSGRLPFGGGGGAGMTVTPVAFIYIKDDDFKVATIENNNIFGAVVEKIPGMICEIKNIMSAARN